MAHYDGFVEAEADRTIRELRQALAEKDHAIQQIREHEFRNGYQEGEAAGEAKYQTLRAQAVRFAQYIKDAVIYDDDLRFDEAEAFLKEHS